MNLGHEQQEKWRERLRKLGYNTSAYSETSANGASNVYENVVNF